MRGGRCRARSSPATSWRSTSALLHAAPGTVGHGGRRAVSLRYVGDDARWGTRPWRTSPPLEPHGLRPGDELDDPRFPVVARAL